MALGSHFILSETERLNAINKNILKAKECLSFKSSGEARTKTIGEALANNGGIMKSSKGMTILSLIIYVIVLTIVIGTASMLMKYFYRNTDELVISSEASSQYSRFITYLTEDVNSRKD